jgi:FkbM family methyltransferase
MKLRELVYRALKPGFISQVRIRFSQIPIISSFLGLNFFSLNLIDKQLDAIINQSDGYFVEIGANDGVDQSNTLFLENSRGWHGVLIEPHPETFRSLIKNRSDLNFFKNAACVGFDYENPTIDLIFMNLMTTSVGIPLEIINLDQHSQDGEKHLGFPSYQFTADAVTLNSILNEANAPRIIDLFSLDVEGAEFHVLSGIDHTKYRFRYLCVESRNFSLIDSYLSGIGYVFVSKLSGHDYLFKDSQMI